VHLIRLAHLVDYFFWWVLFNRRLCIQWCTYKECTGNIY